MFETNRTIATIDGKKKINCTSWYGKYPIIYKVLYISCGAGFLSLVISLKKSFPGFPPTSTGSRVTAWSETTEFFFGGGERGNPHVVPLSLMQVFRTGLT